MTMHNRSIVEEIKWKYQTGGILTRLIMINVAIFLVINIVKVFYVLMAGEGELASNGGRFQHLLQYIMIPSSPMLMLRQFWSVITHMFAHERILHILFNMLWLYWFGTIFKEFIGESKILPTYILGGLMGAVFFVIAYNVFPAFSGTTGYAIGASAAVTAIVVATATMVPNYSLNLMFIGTVQLKWIALVVVVLDFISIPNGNAGGQIAHLGGAFYGFIYTVQYKKGNDFTRPFYSIWDTVTQFFDFSKKSKSGVNRKSKVKMAYRNEEKIKTSAASSTKTNIPDKDKQEKIDEILDKIGRSGYPSLSEEEKAFLFRYSKE
jgi:membrane associated rhomboid family serine protease